MKIFSMMMVCAFAIAGCGGKKPAETTTNTTTTTTTTDSDAGSGSAAASGDGVPCAQEVALVCPDGQIDGCLKTPAEGDTHKCVAK